MSEKSTEEKNSVSETTGQKLHEKQNSDLHREHSMNQNQNRLNREINEELFQQTIKADVSEFSPKKVEYLVGLLEMEEATDEQEINEAQEKFEEFFRHKFRKRIQLNRMKTYRKRLVGAAAALAVLFAAADITTEAVMDESLFHMVGRWKDQIEIIPGKSEDVETEAVDFEEEDTQYFKTNEEFAETFGDDFLVCTWMPENVELRRIYMKSSESLTEILWEYIGDQLDDCRVEVWMYKAADNDTAGYARGLGENEYKQKYIKGNIVTYYQTEEGILAGFEYDGWCYTVDTSVDKDILDSIIGGMILYEAVNE